MPAKNSRNAETVIRELHQKYRLELHEIPVAAIVRDPGNRVIKDDEDLRSLKGSLGGLGQLVPVYVVALADGTYRLIDGERRWMAAQSIGLATLSCYVFPQGAERVDMTIASIVLNDVRTPPNCIKVARWLRHVKNENGLTHEDLARLTSVPLDRIKTYFSLFGASDFLIEFCEGRDVPLKIAVALIRYERATNEAKARQLAKRYVDDGLTCREIDALRRRAEIRSEPESAERKAARRTTPAARWLATRLEAEYKRDQATALAELTGLAGRLGYRLVPATETGQ